LVPQRHAGHAIFYAEHAMLWLTFGKSAQKMLMILSELVEPIRAFHP
jgi:hypothetical protein